MNTRPLAAARIERDAEGVPFSPAFAGRYHPPGGARSQARHVFLAGSGLPERWRGRDRFVVLEIGFGLGNNALATWQAWREDPARSGRLHIVAIEAHPPTRRDIATTPREAPLGPLASELATAWPPLVPGLHRLAFDDERVEMLLAFGDVADWLPQITARVDAFFLDGFAPETNPAMWEPRLFRAMARLAAPDATVATWSAAPAVRDGLAAAGFEVRTAPGQRGHRDITLGRYAPRAPTRPLLRASGAITAGGHVAIVGAGLAGSATAWALAHRHGIASTVHDAAADIATGASGGLAGVFHGVVHRADGRHARWHRAAAFNARTAAATLVTAIGDAAAATCGLLRLGHRDADPAALQGLATSLGLPAEYARVVDAAEASAIAGTRLDAPAWFFAGGGWLNPWALVRHRLDGHRSAAAIDVRLSSPIAALRRDGNRWALLDATGRIVDMADAVVCANAFSAAALLCAVTWPLSRSRGQSSAISLPGMGRAVAPRVPLAGAGYAVATDARTLWFGATSSSADDEPAQRESDRRLNWQRLRSMLPALDEFDPDFVDGRAGVRCTSADRLPLIGAVPDENGVSTRPEQSWHAPRREGLFVVTALGSRGIASSALGGAIVAARIAGAPLPAEADLIDAVDPARFSSRLARVRRA